MNSAASDLRDYIGELRTELTALQRRLEATEEKLAGYVDGASMEANAGDEARAEVSGLEQRLEASEKHLKKAAAAMHYVNSAAMIEGWECRRDPSMIRLLKVYEAIRDAAREAKDEETD